MLRFANEKLGQLLGDDSAALKRQWQQDVALFDPRECFPPTEPGAPDIATQLRSRTEILAQIVAAPVPRLSTSMPE